MSLTHSELHPTPTSSRGLPRPGGWFWALCQSCFYSVFLSPASVPEADPEHTSLHKPVGAEASMCKSAGADSWKRLWRGQCLDSLGRGDLG